MSVLKEPLYMGLDNQQLPDLEEQEHLLSRSDRLAWRKLLGVLSAVQEGVRS